MTIVFKYKAVRSQSTSEWWCHCLLHLNIFYFISWLLLSFNFLNSICSNTWRWCLDITYWVVTWLSKWSRVSVLLVLSIATALWNQRRVLTIIWISLRRWNNSWSIDIHWKWWSWEIFNQWLRVQYLTISVFIMS